MAPPANRRSSFAARRITSSHGWAAVRDSALEVLESRVMFASDFKLVSDINTAPITAGSSIERALVVGDRLFFPAVNRTQGQGLWVSDGTGEGTQMLLDVSEITSENIRELTNFNNQLYFVADGGLYKSDGTVAGTRLVKDLQVGPEFVQLTVVNDKMFFVAPSATGLGLWRTDGTAEGTDYLENVFSPSNLVNVSGTLYFSAVGAFLGHELWSSDGTSLGTKMVKDIWDGRNGSYPQSLTNVGGVLFFVAKDSTSGYEVWRSTGPNGSTEVIADINPGNNSTSSSKPSRLTVIDNSLYFRAANASLGAELWRVDRGSLGALLVKDFNPGAGSSNPDRLVNVNGTLFLFADDGVSGHSLWKTDGTNAGTSLVKDVNSQVATSNAYSSIYYHQISFNNTLYFTADDGQSGYELWRSDGTSSGTLRVEDIRKGSGASTPRWLNPLHGKFFFAANDGLSGLELWQSDGTSSGTLLVKDIFTGTRSSSPGNLTNVSGELYFTATDGVTGYELWRSNGRAGGTRLVSDIASGSTSSSPSALTNVNGVLFFKANDSVHGNTLWYTAPRTSELLPVLDPSGNFLAVRSMANLNGSLVFTAQQSLWAIDQPQASPTVRLVRDSLPIKSDSYFTEVNGRLFFQTTDLWITDGTTSGTLLVKNINPSGLDFPYLDNKPVNVGGVLYFVANDGTHGIELWKSDGTAAGTVLVKDIHEGANSSGLKQLTDVGGVLYMVANDGTAGLSLWRSNGTSAETQLVKDFAPENIGESFQPRQLTNLNGTLNFTVNTVEYGDELWRSSGTEAGTLLVVDLFPGKGSSSAVLLGVIDNSLYFSAADSRYGARLWLTDGSAAGTVLAQSANSRNAPFRVSSVVSTGDSLFVAAQTEQFGTEVLVAGRFAWQNYARPTDVSADGNVTPFDALLIINRLNQNLPSRLPGSLPVPFSPATYFDVNGDGNVTALDALLVINQINLGDSEGEADPEFKNALIEWELVNAPFALEDIRNAKRFYQSRM